jgi:hypothetical protein
LVVRLDSWYHVRIGRSVVTLVIRVISCQEQPLGVVYKHGKQPGQDTPICME